MIHIIAKASMRNALTSIYELVIDADMRDLVLDTAVIRERLGGISQGDLAGIAHVDQSSVSLWEANKNAPSRAAAALIEQHCTQNNIELAWKAAPARKAKVAA